MKLIFVLLSSLYLLSAAQAETPSRKLRKAAAEIAKFAKAQGSEPYKLHLSKENAPKGFTIYCPVKTCPSAEYDLWYSAENSILMNIAVTTLNGLSLETFVEKFGHAVIFIDFSKHFSDKAFKITVDEVIRNEDIHDWKFESFDGVNLKGKFSRKISYFTIQRTDDWGKEHCQMEDAPAPRGCYKSMKSSMNVEVSFDLPVQLTPYGEIL